MSTFVVTIAWLILSPACTGDDRPPPLTFKKHVDYVGWYNAFVATGPETDNAAPLYDDIKNAAGAKDGFPKPPEKVKEELLQAMMQTWKPEEHPELAAYLEQCKPALATFTKVEERPRYWESAPKKMKSLYMLLLPDPATSVNATRALLAETMMQQEDRTSRLTAAYRIILRSADHMQQSSMLIGVLVSCAQRHIVDYSIRDGLSDHVFPDKSLSTLYKTLRRYDPGPADQTRWIRLQWAMNLDTLQYACPYGKFNVARWKEIQGGAESISGGGADAPFDPEKTIAIIDAHYEDVLRILEGPLSAAKARKLSEFVMNEDSAWRKNGFTSVTLANPARAYTLQLRAEADHRATMLVLAIHAHHAKHGEWPASLAKIDKKLGLKGLKALRQDPCSDKEFVYKLKDGQPWLYSVLADGKDNGGAHDAKWGEDKPDSDYVFWPRVE